MAFMPIPNVCYAEYYILAKIFKIYRKHDQRLRKISIQTCNTSRALNRIQETVRYYYKNIKKKFATDKFYAHCKAVRLKDYKISDLLCKSSAFRRCQNVLWLIDSYSFISPGGQFN